MNLNSFDLGEEVKLSFNVNIAGTGTSPSEVRVILGQDQKLMVTAVKEENEYVAHFKINENLFKLGDASFMIEVLIGGKVFVPFKHNVSIIESSAQVSQIELQQPIIIDKKIEIKPAIAEEKVEDKKPITGSKPQPIQEVKSILEETL